MKPRTEARIREAIRIAIITVPKLGLALALAVVMAGVLP